MRRFNLFVLTLVLLSAVVAFSGGTQYGPTLANLRILYHNLITVDTSGNASFPAQIRLTQHSGSAADKIAIDTKTANSYVGFVFQEGGANKGLIQYNGSGYTRPGALEFTTQNGDIGFYPAGVGQFVLSKNGSMQIGTGTVTGIGTSRMSIFDNYAASAGITLIRFSDSTAPIVRQYKSRGSSTASAAVLANDNLGNFSAWGNNGAGFNGAGTMGWRAAENWTATSCGSYFNVYCTPAGTTTAALSMRLCGGNGASFSAGLHADGNITGADISGTHISTVGAIEASGTISTDGSVQCNDLDVDNGITASGVSFLDDVGINGTLGVIGDLGVGGNASASGYIHSNTGLTTSGSLVLDGTVDGVDVAGHVASTGTAVHGLGTMSTQNANAVAITGGAVETTETDLQPSVASAGWSGKTIRRHVYKVLPSTSDNVASCVFKITTTDETGDFGGGTYAVFVVATVGHPGNQTPTYTAAKAFQATFCRAVDKTSAGVNSAVTEIAESASAAGDPVQRDISAITMTASESTELVNDVLFQVDITGNVLSNITIECDVTLVYSGFLTEPTITMP